MLSTDIEIIVYYSNLELALLELLIIVSVQIIIIYQVVQIHIMKKDFLILLKEIAMKISILKLVELKYLKLIFSK